MTTTLDALESVLTDLERVVVAFSGGADSAFLAVMARRTLGARARAVTAVSPSLPAAELEACARLATQWDLDWEPVPTDEMDDERYRVNGADRCWHCKDALMRAMAPIADAAGATPVLGVNLDDLGDHRPGQDAAAAGGARFPLVEAGFTKEAVRAASRQLGLETWDKPAAACLASRLPYGTHVTVELLGRVERAEAAMRRLGFGQLRVRHHGDTARIEVPVDDLVRVVDNRGPVVDALHAAGYRYVSLDLEGFRSGSLNLALDDHQARG